MSTNVSILGDALQTFRKRKKSLMLDLEGIGVIEKNEIAITRSNEDRNVEHDVTKLSRAELEDKFLQLQQQNESLRGISREMTEEINSLKRGGDNQQLKVAKTITHHTSQSNEQLKSKIRMLENCIHVTDLQRASLVYSNKVLWQDLTGKRGILKFEREFMQHRISKKGNVMHISMELPCD